jgi:hypothetical protein
MRLPRNGSKAFWSCSFATSIFRSVNPVSSAITGLETRVYVLTIATLPQSLVLPSPMSSDKQTNQHNEASSLETDISTPASLVASTTVTTTANGDRAGEPETVDGGEADELGVEEVEELMRRIEAANSIADGVESKLDGILEHLDGLLGSLETRGEGKENGDPTTSHSDR